MFCAFCLSSSLSRSSIHSIHYTYYSLAVSGLLSSFFMITFLFFSECALFDSFLFSKYNLVIFSLLCFYLNLDCSVLIGIILVTLFFIVFGFLWVYACFYSCFFFMLVSFILPLAGGVFSAYLLCILAFILTFFLFMWINDLITECSFALTNAECYSLVSGIKLLILSEFMLFFCVFWCEINFRFLLSFWSCFNSMPLVNASSFSIPFSNVIILLFSSLPIQATIVFYKVGLFFSCIEQLGQAVSCGTCFLVLQIKEFMFSFHSLTDCMIGSIFYFTTGLHGMHVLMGLIYFYLMLLSFNLRLQSFSYLCFNFYPLTFNSNSNLRRSIFRLLSFNLNPFFDLSFLSSFNLRQWIIRHLCFNLAPFFNLSPLVNLKSLSFKCLTFSNKLFKQYLRIIFGLLLYFLIFRAMALANYLLLDSCWFNFRLLSLHFNFSRCVLCSLVLWSVRSIFSRLLSCFNSWLWCKFMAKNKLIRSCLLVLSIISLTARVSLIKLNLKYGTLNWIWALTFNFSLLSFNSNFLFNSRLLSFSSYFKLCASLSYLFFIEFSDSLLFSSYYWHFVDIIWVMVFILFFY